MSNFADLPMFSVIITTHNRPQLLLKCIESVLHQDFQREKYEIIVVDDGSHSKTAHVLQMYCESGDIEYIRQDQQGWARARLTGANHSQGEILAFIDDDCVACPQWLSIYAHAYRSFPDADGIGGSLRPAQKHNLAGMKQYRGHLEYFLRMNELLNAKIDEPSRVWYTFGGNRTFKRDVWLGAQPSISLWYYDDTAIDENLCAKEAVIYYQPAAYVDHYYHLSLMQRLRSAHRYGRSENVSGHLQISQPPHTIRDRWTHLHHQFPESTLLERIRYAITQPLVWGARRLGQLQAYLGKQL